VVAKLLAGAVVLVLVGCATPRAASQTQTATWIAEAHAAGLELEAPLTLSPHLLSVIREQVGYAGTEKSRALKVVRYLGDSDGLAFRYQPQMSLSAEKAFAARQGDCMSYANLFVALARAMDVPVRYVRITQLPVSWESGGRFFESSHMAVAQGRDASWDQALVVDFGNVHTAPWRFALYDDVSDDEAFVLFQNNLAVERMLAGDVAGAERILRFFQTRAPATPEVSNNLALVLMQSRRDREAMDLLIWAVERFPRFRPLVSNAVQAARRLGDEVLASSLEARGRELLEDEPAWNFNEGLRSYHTRSFSTAALRFEKALSADPGNVRLLAWSARAHLAAGNLRRGLEQVERLRARPPSQTRSELLNDLRREFPQLDLPMPLIEPPPVAERR
jgi:Transglutaminase-like superfamily/Tetratricopeptide repeat